MRYLSRMGAIALAAAGSWAIAQAASAGDQVPTFAIEPQCRALEGAAPRGDSDLCVAKERAARQQLVEQWERFAPADRAHCLDLALREPTYTQLLTCLELAREARGRAREQAQHDRAGDVNGLRLPHKGMPASRHPTE